jgi:hypothetical protein
MGAAWERHDMCELALKLKKTKTVQEKQEELVIAGFHRQLVKERRSSGLLHSE